ncbi:unnamed protein product [Pleuronectes platessa]|uniref:Uncharacterized protein n=1 Tax=Pleuronectes platessa TaxID=8262 RepID=A0A9N7YRQ1_PLEPL|nr:unnamed protein product [Pleuronectes platessa]
MSAECDLPCREHYYPREEFSTGEGARCHLQQPGHTRREAGVAALQRSMVGCTQRAHSPVAFFLPQPPVSCEQAGALTPAAPRLAGVHSGTISLQDPGGRGHKEQTSHRGLFHVELSLEVN